MIGGHVLYICLTVCLSEMLQKTNAYFLNVFEIFSGFLHILSLFFVVTTEHLPHNSLYLFIHFMYCCATYGSCLPCIILISSYIFICIVNKTNILYKDDIIYKSETQLIRIFCFTEMSTPLDQDFNINCLSKF